MDIFDELSQELFHNKEGDKKMGSQPSGAVDDKKMSSRSTGVVDDKEMSRLLSLCGAKAPLLKEYKDKFSTKRAGLKKPASCNSVLKRRLCEKTVDPRWQAKGQRKEQQKMKKRI